MAKPPLPTATPRRKPKPSIETIGNRKLSPATLMMGFGFDDIGQLAGGQDNFWRQEFLQLNQLAASMKGG